MSTQPDMVCVNPGDSGLVTLFRVYPQGIDARVQFEKELNEPALHGDLLMGSALCPRGTR